MLQDVFAGGNLRVSTEALTRTTLLELQGPTRKWLWGRGGFDDVIAEAVTVLESRGRPLDKLWALWVLGLTNKQRQNVLRGGAYDDYVRNYANAIRRAAIDSRTGTEDLESKLKEALFGQVLGAQTLTIRGSHKSTFGKFWERLVLAALLELLGLEFDDGGSEVGSYWLNDRRDGAREADAVAYVSRSLALHIDIGFIGEGNPEILLDKVSRYGRTRDLNGAQVGVMTVVLGDRIGERGSLVERAKSLGGLVIEMGRPEWVQKFSSELLESSAPLDVEDRLLEIVQMTKEQFVAQVAGVVDSDFIRRVYSEAEGGVKRPRPNDQ